MAVYRFMTGLIILIALTSTGEGEDSVKTVEYVDLQRYLGLWYEIAKIPNRFQDQCLGNTTAEYSMLEDDLIKVVNRCQREENRDEIEGVAKVVDTQTNARLKVSFVRFLGKQWFWGNYWIIGLDENYQWAVVGTPSRKFGWILCRQPEMAPEELERCYQILRDNGYNPDEFEQTPQNQVR